ncbi:MAG: hypothetical protein K2F63_05635 [Muribaculaceae bacterium]|nr:hypothetical protein [Muribaculaceae bacterium]MDE6134181.1 hypothetical protein [Muribaculaceae bacterium]
MEDDKIKDLFAGFSPELSDSRDFMERLERTTAAMDSLRERNEELRRNTRQAMAGGAVAGFAAGVFLTLAAPVLKPWLMRALSLLPVAEMGIDYNVVALVAVCATSVLTALGTYNSIVEPVSRP